MITIEKLNEYAEYHGFYDGFYIRKVKIGTNINNDDEWNLIGNFIQDIRLVKKDLVSKEFILKLELKLNEHCDNEETLTQLKKLSEEEW